MTAEEITSVIDALKAQMSKTFPGADSIAAMDSVADAAKKAAQNAQPDPALTELSLQAEYAIGKGLITQPELDDLRNRYGAQGDLSLGLLPPFLLLVFALLVEGQTEGLFAYAFALFAVAVISGVLFFLAIERRSQYRTELRLLLLGRIQKQVDADQAAKQAKKDAQKDSTTKDTPDAITKAVQDAISKLKLEVKPLIVQVQTDQPPAKKTDPSATKAVSGATPTQTTVPPTTPPTGQTS